MERKWKNRPEGAEAVAGQPGPLGTPGGPRRQLWSGSGTAAARDPARACLDPCSFFVSLSQKGKLRLIHLVIQTFMECPRCHSAGESRVEKTKALHSRGGISEIVNTGVRIRRNQRMWSVLWKGKGRSEMVSRKG